MAALCKSDAPLCDADGCGRRHARIMHVDYAENRMVRKRSRTERDAPENLAENAKGKDNREWSSFGASSSTGRGGEDGQEQ